MQLSRFPSNVFHSRSGLLGQGLTLAAACLFLAMPGAQLPGQTQPTESNDDRRIEVSPLETYHLLGKDGQPIPYFKMTFDEFERAFKILRGGEAGGNLDRYSIRSVDVVAKVRNDIANLDITLNVDPRVDGTIRIPIKLDNVIFFPDKNSPDVHRNDGKYILEVDATKDRPLEIQLSGRRKITEVGREKSLQLELPSSTFARLQLHELLPAQEFQVPQSAFTEKLTPFFEGGSSVDIQGLRDSVSVSWSPANERRSASGAQPQIRVETSATVDRTQVEYATDLTITSPQLLSGFRIDIPREANDFLVSPSSYQAIGEESPSDKFVTYYVRFPEPRSVVDDLSLAWSVADGGEQSSVTLDGFRIQDVRLTDGELTVRGQDDVLFGIRNEFNLEDRVVNAADESLTFRLKSMAFGAEVVRFTPSADTNDALEFQLKIVGSKANLEIRLTREMLVTQPDLALDLKGWTLAPNQPLARALNASNGRVEFDGLLIPSARRAEKILLNFPIRLGATSVLTLPEFRNNSRTRFRMIVTTTDPVEVVVNNSENPGWEPNSGFESEKIITGQTGEWSSQLPSVPNFTFEAKLLPQRLSGSQQIVLEEVRGQLLRRITHQLESDSPLNAIAVRISSAADLKMFRDGAPLAFETLESDDRSYLIVDVPPTSSLEFTSVAPLAIANELDEFSMPLTQLFVPARAEDSDPGNLVEIDGRSFRRLETQDQLEIRVPPGTQIEPNSSWIATGKTSEATRFSPAKPGEMSSVALTRSRLFEDDVQVKKVWCHTSLAGGLRQDRIIIRFQPKQSLIRWQLPEGATLVACRLNSREIMESYDPESNRVVTGIDSFGQDYVVEFLCKYYSAGSTTKTKLRLPKTNRVLWSRKVYWSLNLPDNEYVLFNSANLSADFKITGTGFLLRPTSGMTHRELARWVQTDTSGDPSLESADYLFTSFGVSDEAEVFITSKRNLVIFFGLFFLLAGSVFISLPIFRNAFVMVAVAVGFLVVAVWYPIWFIQLLQIELLVGFIVCLGLIVARLTNWFGQPADETRIETNVPSLALAAPDSKLAASSRIQSTQRRVHPGGMDEGAPVVSGPGDEGEE